MAPSISLMSVEIATSHLSMSWIELERAAPLDQTKYGPLYLATSGLQTTLARELDTRTSIFGVVRARRP